MTLTPADLMIGEAVYPVFWTRRDPLHHYPVHVEHVYARDADEAVRAVADAIHDSGVYADHHIAVTSGEQWRHEP